jgi:dTMP kinase
MRHRRTPIQWPRTPSREVAISADATPIGRSASTAHLPAVLRDRSFRRLWLVLGLSSLGDWLGLLATSLFAANQVSGSTAQGAAFGGVIVARLLPAMVLGPVAGVLADRFDRRFTMVICDLLRFLLFASIPLVGLVVAGASSVTWALIATFLIEAASLFWIPAKEAAVPNLVPQHRLEVANQLFLITTYGVTPVLAAGLLGLLSRGLAHVGGSPADMAIGPVEIALYANALTFLASALVVWRIRGISIRNGGPRPAGSRAPGLLRSLVSGWQFVRTTPLVRGLVQGILGALATGGVVIGTGKFYAASLGGGEATFSLLFGTLFVGLGLGMGFGPPLVGNLSRRRWFGMSIVLSGAAVIGLALAPHLAVAVPGTLLVGAGAGMAYLSGITLLGREVDDELRGRTFAFVQTSVRVVLMLSIAVTSLLVGIGGARRIDLGAVVLPFNTVRVLLLVAGLLAVAAGIASFRRMDDRPGVPVLGDLLASVRGRRLTKLDPQARGGLFIAFEGGEGVGKSTQAIKLAAWLKVQGYDYVITREPGATDLGARIRGMLLDPSSTLSARTEAMLYAADRSHHVAAVLRPALARGAVVVTDRFVDSSLAYQGAGRDLPVEDVAWLSTWATGGLQPDLIVLLDLDPVIGLSRAADRGQVDRLEAEQLDFHRRVRTAFLDLARADSRRYLVIDATAQPDQVAVLVRERVGGILKAAGLEPRADARSGSPRAVHPDASSRPPAAPVPAAPPSGAQGAGPPPTVPAQHPADEPLPIDGSARPIGATGSLPEDTRAAERR